MSHVTAFAASVQAAAHMRTNPSEIEQISVPMQSTAAAGGGGGLPRLLARSDWCAEYHVTTEIPHWLISCSGGVAFVPVLRLLCG